MTQVPHKPECRLKNPCNCGEWACQCLCNCFTPTTSGTEQGWVERFEEKFSANTENINGVRYFKGQATIEMKSFIRETLATEREKAQAEERYEILEKLPPLVGEDGKLFSKMIAKASEAPFREVALQYAMQRLAQAYEKRGRSNLLEELEGFVLDHIVTIQDQGQVIFAADFMNHLTSLKEVDIQKHE